MQGLCFWAQCGASSPRESAPASDGQNDPSALALGRGGGRHLQAPGGLSPLSTVAACPSLPSSHSSVPLPALPGGISQVSCSHAKLYAKASFGGAQPQARNEEEFLQGPLLAPEDRGPTAGCKQERSLRLSPLGREPLLTAASLSRAGNDGSAWS